MDLHHHLLIARALAAEAEALDLQLAAARLIGRGRAITQASRETRRQHKNTWALARKGLAADPAAASRSLEEPVRPG